MVRRFVLNRVLLRSNHPRHQLSGVSEKVFPGTLKVLAIAYCCLKPSFFSEKRSSERVPNQRKFTATLEKIAFSDAKDFDSDPAFHLDWAPDPDWTEFIYCNYILVPNTYNFTRKLNVHS